MLLDGEMVISSNYPTLFSVALKRRVALEDLSVEDAEGRKKEYFSPDEVRALLPVLTENGLRPLNEEEWVALMNEFGIDDGRSTFRPRTFVDTLHLSYGGYVRDVRSYSADPNNCLLVRDSGLVGFYWAINSDDFDGDFGMHGNNKYLHFYLRHPEYIGISCSDVVEGYKIRCTSI